MAYSDQNGTQQNGQAGSSTSASIANAAVQSPRTRGASPSMNAMANAAQSYQDAAAPTAQPEETAAETTAQATTTQTQTQAPGTNAWGQTVPQPGQPAFPGGPPAPVAGGGWDKTTYKTPYGPASEDWLQSMQGDVRKSQAQTMTDQLRGLRSAMAATPGMAGSGASAAAIADMYRRGGTEMQGQLSTAMLGQYGDERNRLAQAWGKEGDWAMGRDTARMQSEAQMAAASSNAAAAGASADMQYQLGLKELELRDKLGMGDIDIRQAQIDYDYFRTQMEAMMNSLGDGYGTTYPDVQGPGYETGAAPPTPPA